MLAHLLQDGSDLRALCLVAHCDDETLMCGGLLARIARQGGAVRVAAFCGGDPVRRAELAAACDRLGCESLALDYADATLHAGMFHELAGQAAGLIRAMRPQLVITHDPEFDYNPEHLLLARVVQYAAQKAGMAAGGWRPELLLAGEIHTPLPFPDTLVDISGVLDDVRAALACHASQLAPGHKAGYYARLLDARCAWRGVQAGCAAAMAFRYLPLPVIGDLYGVPACV